MVPAFSAIPQPTPMLSTASIGPRCSTGAVLPVVTPQQKSWQNKENDKPRQINNPPMTAIQGHGRVTQLTDRCILTSQMSFLRPPSSYQHPRAFCSQASITTLPNDYQQKKGMLDSPQLVSPVSVRARRKGYPFLDEAPMTPRSVRSGTPKATDISVTETLPHAAKYS